MGEKAEHYRKLIEQLNKLGLKNVEAAASKARKTAQRAREKGDEAYGLFFEGEASAYEHDYDRAEGLEKRAVELLPGNAFVLSNYAVVLASMGRRQEAIKCYDKALLINPNSDHALSSKGVSLSELGRVEEAIKCYDKALLINPSSDGALRNKGVSLCKLGRVEEAIKCLDKALALNPESVHALANKGAALVKLGRHEDALGCYERAAEIQPWDHIDLNWLTTVYLELGKLEEAERTARHLIKVLEDRGASTKYASYKLNRILAKKELRKRTPADEELDEYMTNVLESFGPEKIQNLLDKVAEHQRKHHGIVRNTSESRKKKEAPEEGCLCVLRRWNSYTPMIYSEESKGGGYFLCLGGKGIVIDPGFDFVRNYFGESYSIRDIDCIFVTHAHLDHMADVEALFTLFHEANEKREERDKHKIDLYVNLGCMKKLAGWLDLQEDYIERIHVLEQGVQMEMGNSLSVLPARARHEEVIDDIYCLGLVFDDGNAKVGFTGDTGWEPDGVLAEPFQGCSVLVAHLGGIYPKEFQETERFHEHHLGILGTSGMIGKARPDLCIVSEFGEELVGLRRDIADGLTKALDTRCIAADVGTEVAFTKPPSLRCAVCGRFSKKFRRKYAHQRILYMPCSSSHAARRKCAQDSSGRWRTVLMWREQLWARAFVQRRAS